MRFAFVPIMLAAVLFVGRAEEPPAPKPTGDELQKEAARCASILYQFAVVKKDFFPAGLGKRIVDNKFYDDPAQWPPPKIYSWRVAVLPFLEQNHIYKHLLNETETFKVPVTLSAAELKKRQNLSQLLNQMPEWMTLPHLKKQANKSIYRRVLSKEKPDLFIIIESAELSEWFRGGDDLELADGKPLPKFGGNFLGGFFALCGDGEVRFLPGTLSDKEIRRALVAGGETVRPLRCKYRNKLEEDIKGLGFGK